MIKNTLFLALTATLFSGCFGEPDPIEWTAYIYPDKNNMKRSLILPQKFKTIEQCRATAIARIKTDKIEKRADYKCGRNCNFHDGMKLDICEEMRR